jgi:hypothetical protein
MHYILGLTTILTWLCASAVHADIYIWTDDNGVKHITNTSPPPDATILMREHETPYDEAADRARQEAERRARLENAKIEQAENEARLLKKQLAVQRQILENQRQAEENMRQAEIRLNAAGDDRDAWSRGGYPIYGWYPYRLYPAPYYRKDGNIYYYHRGLHRKQPHHKSKLAVTGHDPDVYARRPAGLRSTPRYPNYRAPTGALRNPRTAYRYTRRY